MPPKARAQWWTAMPPSGRCPAVPQTVYTSARRVIPIARWNFEAAKTQKKSSKFEVSQEIRGEIVQCAGNALAMFCRAGFGDSCFVRGSRTRANGLLAVSRPLGHRSGLVVEQHLQF